MTTYTAECQTGIQSTPAVHLVRERTSSHMHFATGNITEAVQCTNLLLTERNSHTKEYWPWLHQCRTETTEGQYTTAWLHQVRLVIKLDFIGFQKQKIHGI